MPPRLAVVLGLLAGVVTAGLVLAAIVAFTPGPVHATPTPSAPPSVVDVSPSPSATPSPVPSASISPSASVIPSASIPPSPSAGASQSAEASPSDAGTAFGIDADGIVRAGALGGVGPDIMAASLQKILPGTTVTP